MTDVIGRDVARQTRRGSGDVRWVGELYDRHGASLFNLAYVVTLDPLVADAAVVRAFTLASAAATEHPEAPITAQELARLTFLACRSDEPSPAVPPPPGPRRDGDGASTGVTGCWDAMSPRQRALLALTVHGGHSYRDAALLLQLDPSEAAEVLRATLHEAAVRSHDET